MSKQQKLDANPKPMQQVSFTGNRADGWTTFFVIEEVKETVLAFWKGIVKV